MGDDDDGVLLRHFSQRQQQRGFAFEIEVVAGLVQDQHRGVAQEQLRQAQLAQLARRDARAAFAEHGLVAVGQAADEAMRARQLAGHDDGVAVGFGVDHAQRVDDRAAEPVGLLREATDPAAQVAARELRHVVLVDRDAALCGLVQTREHLGQRGFACAVASDDGVNAAGADFKRDLVERGVAVRVLKAHLIEAEQAARAGQVDGLGQLLQRLFEHGLQSRGGFIGACQRAPVAGQLRDRAQRLAGKQIDGHEAADAHPLLVDGDGTHGDHGHGEHGEQHVAGLAGVFHLAVLAKALAQPTVVARLPGLLGRAVVTQHFERGAGIADLGGAAIELAGLFDLLDPAGADLIGPPPGEHAQNHHRHQNHRQHGPGDDADDDQRDDGHRQIEHGSGQPARDAGAHRADILEELQPLAGGALFQRQKRVAQHAVHERLRDFAVDGGTGFTQGAGTAAAQPEFQTQKAQGTRDHGGERGRSSA